MLETVVIAGVMLVVATIAYLVTATSSGSHRRWPH